VGICCTGTEPTGTEGAGDPRRAIDWPRETDAAGELCSEARGEEGTASGLVGSEASFAMLGTKERLRVAPANVGAVSIALQELGISSCNARIGSKPNELPRSKDLFRACRYAL
jgi:hypothetical protein